MTLEEAKKEISDIDRFCHAACIQCSSEWFCPTYCEMLEKARKISYERLLKCYARNDGDWRKVFRYVNRTRI